jgi:TRAP-type C4-dicarboxylate transport system permease small subunit
MQSILRTHDRISDGAFVLACTALVLMFGSYLWEVVARYGFNSPTQWSSDLVQYLLAATTALSLPLVTRDGGHVAITSFVDKLPASAKPTVTRLLVWIGAFVLAAIAVLFVNASFDQARQGVETIAAFAIPKWWLSALVVYGATDSALHLVRQGLNLETVRAGHDMDV